MAKFWAFLIAVCVHLFVIAGLNLTPKSPANRKKEKIINITFEKRIAKKSEINQVAENQTQVVPVEEKPIVKEIPKEEIKKPVEPPKPKIIPKPVVEAKPKPVQKIISVPKSEKIVVEKKISVEPIKPKVEQVEKKPKIEKPKKVVEHIEQPKPQPEPPRPKLSLDLVMQQTADLAKNIGTPNDSNQQEIKYVEEFGGSQKDSAEQYRKRFIAKITKKFYEMYPDKKLSGTLNIKVEIKTDGTLTSLKITKAVSAEYAKLFSEELKEAAEKTIRASTPFEPLPFELGTSVLGISQSFNIVEEAGN